MNKTTLIMVLFTLIFSPLCGQENFFIGFEGPSEDNWPYTTNIPFYELNPGNTDLWSAYNEVNGRVEEPYAGVTYLAGRDLDNPHSEAYSGQDSPEHILDLAPRALEGQSAEFTFRLNYVSLDKNDYIFYEIAYDNGTSWASPDVHVDVFRTSRGGQFSSLGWEEVRFDVPSGLSYVRVRVVIYQNGGNEYLGMDNFELKFPTLSTSNNKIEGFAFGPNPTSGILRMSAKVMLDKIHVYDILGKKVLQNYGGANKVTLDLSGLANGVYLAKVESMGITQTMRIVKK
jgi:hypothetical protein